MGKAKEPYWSYVKAIIKEYPALKKQLAKPLEQRVTAYLGAGGRGSRIANPVSYTHLDVYKRQFLGCPSK